MSRCVCVNTNNFFELEKLEFVSSGQALVRFSIVLNISACFKTDMCLFGLLKFLEMISFASIS